ncbi:hypothetical protein Tco_0340917 [Tanacetum coccineum]
MASMSRFDLDNMADENVPAPAPTRSDEQILPFDAWLDKTRLTLDANLLREALDITPIDQAHQFVSPPSGDAIMDFVNKLGYTEAIHFVSRMMVNNLYQPWRAILSMINQCLTCKTSGSTSSFHLAEEDFRLGNLKFVPKGEVDEVFGMPIPNELISNNIRNAPYYNAYLEMVAKHDQKVAAEKEGKKKTASTKQPKSKSATKKSSKPAPAAKPKPAKEKPSKPSTAKPPIPKPAKPTPLQRPTRPEQEGEEYDMEHAIQMSLESFQAQGHVHVGDVAIQEPVAEAIRPLPVVEGKGKAIVTEEQAAQSLLALHTPKRRSTTDQFIFQRWTPATEEASTVPSAQPHDDTSANIVCDSPSSVDAETGAGSDKTNSRELAERVVALEKKFSDLEQTNKNLDKTTRNLGSRVYTLELRDLPYKIDEVVYQNVKEAVQIALQAPLRDRFRDLSEEDMHEMLHQRMFESDTYKLLPKHIALYEALEASMARAQRDEFLAEKDKSRKRRRDDQDLPPLPPPPDSDLSKRRRHDTGTSGSSLPQAPQSSAWKKSDTRDAPSSISKQQSGPNAEQPVEHIPIPDSANISDLEDTDSAYLPKIKQMLEWLKPILDDERPATLKPAWVIPTSHIPDAVNNWANVLATTYQALSENSLLENNGDMRTFMN